MLTKLFKHISSLMITLKCFQDTLSGPGINKLLHLVIMLLNFSVEKEAHAIVGRVRISFNILELICQLCTELND